MYKHTSDFTKELLQVKEHKQGCGCSCQYTVHLLSAPWVPNTLENINQQPLVSINQDTTSTGRAIKSSKRKTEEHAEKSRRQSTSGRTLIQRSIPHRGLNFPQSTTLCWDQKQKHCLEILLETLDLSSSQYLPTDEETNWSWNDLA